MDPYQTCSDKVTVRRRAKAKLLTALFSESERMRETDEECETKQGEKDAQ